MTEGAPADLTARIRSEALRLFAHVGYGSTTIDEIADAAGVGVATIYRRWNDKTELANDLYKRILDDMEALMRPPEGPNAKRRFMSVWDQIWAFAHDDPDRFIFIEAQTHEAWINPSNRARKAALAEQAAVVLQDAGVRAPAELANAMTIGTLTALLRGDTEADKTDVGERIWQALRLSGPAD